MSRGLGKIEKAIIEILSKEEECPINYITYEISKRDPSKKYNQNLYKSVLRAIRSLKKKGIVWDDKEDVEEFTKGMSHERQGPFPRSIYLNSDYKRSLLSH